MTTDEDWRAPGAPTPPSPVLTGAIAQVTSGLDQLLAVAAASLSDEDVARLLDFATSCVDRAAGVVTAAVGEADHRRLGDAVGARHTGQWWAGRSLLTRPEANRLTRLGRLLGDELYAPVQTALAGGELHADQAAVIVNAVEAIPTSPDDLPSYADAPAALKARARDHLLTLAKDHDARQLKRLGRRILDTVAPEVGEAAEAKALADEEAAAARKVSLTLRDNGNGTSTGRFILPTAAAEMFRKQLMAIAAPKHQTETHDSEEPPDRDERPLHARLGWAFIEWIERYPADHLPASGGVSATVVITMPLDTLRGGLAAASLDAGARISAGESRRLACEAGIIPAVLGGRSEVLDLGRTRRFHTRAQRIAIAQRDGGCTAEGCDLPPGACHVHHDQPWSRGGPTNTATGRLLCHRHHRAIHDDRYATTRRPNGKVSFHRRTLADRRWARLIGHDGQVTTHLTDLDVALAAASAGARVVRAAYGGSLIRHAKSGLDFATNADLDAERAILEVIASARPDDARVGEETGAGGGTGSRRWLVDPLCGTLNFAAQTPLVAVNVALIDGSAPLACASADPISGETFWADTRGAFVRYQDGDESIHPSSRSLLVDVNCDGPESRPFLGPQLLGDAAFRRSFGPRVTSTTLAVAWVAAGRRAAYVTDGTFVDNVHFAAGIGLCRGAGCVVSDLAGDALNTRRGLIVAADPDVHERLVDIIAPHLAEVER